MTKEAQEQAILDAALARARENNEAEAEARAVVDKPEFQEAVKELELGAPEGEGPFVQDYGLLRELRESPGSDRREEVVADHLRTNPIGDGPHPKVMLRPRPREDAHVTAPSLIKMRELGVHPDAIAAGRAIGGHTLRLAKPSVESESTDDQPTRERRVVWPWAIGSIAVLITAAIVVGAIVQPNASKTTDPSATTTTKPSSTTATAAPLLPASTITATADVESGPTASGVAQASATAIETSEPAGLRPSTSPRPTARPDRSATETTPPPPPPNTATPTPKPSASFEPWW